MARSSKLSVMLSSKCNSRFPLGSAQTLSEIRRELKRDIEGMRIGGKQVFDVWINEAQAPKAGTLDSWDECMQAVRNCDVLIVLYNGDAGWANESSIIGICHAEMMTGLNGAPAKVRLIALPEDIAQVGEQGERNNLFKQEVARQNIFRGGKVIDKSTLKARVLEALRDALICLAQAGSKDAARGRFHSGAALDWSRLDFRGRREAMVKIGIKAIATRIGASESGMGVAVKVQNTHVLFCVYAIPAALSVAAAHESVGRPFLFDHERVGALIDGVAGPIHVILCHKTATESQAAKLLGFPDATIVSAPFGIFVADLVQHVQFVLIKDCRDEFTTCHGIQRFFEWLAQSGEDTNVARRAKHRAAIVGMIASTHSNVAKAGGVSVSLKSTNKKQASSRAKR